MIFGTPSSACKQQYLVVTVRVLDVTMGVFDIVAN